MAGRRASRATSSDEIRRQHLFPVISILGIEYIDTGYGHQTGLYSLLMQRRYRIHTDTDLRASGQNNHRGLTRAIFQDVGAAGDITQLLFAALLMF